MNPRRRVGTRGAAGSSARKANTKKRATKLGALALRGARQARGRRLKPVRVSDALLRDSKLYFAALLHKGFRRPRPKTLWVVEYEWQFGGTDLWLKFARALLTRAAMRKEAASYRRATRNFRSVRTLAYVPRSNRAAPLVSK